MRTCISVCCTARTARRTSICCWRTLRPTAPPLHRVVDTYADPEKWNRMSLHNIARSGIFSADRSIADYADTIWHVPYKK